MAQKAIIWPETGQSTLKIRVLWTRVLWTDGRTDGHFWLPTQVEPENKFLQDKKSRPRVRFLSSFCLDCIFPLRNSVHGAIEKERKIRPRHTPAWTALYHAEKFIQK